VPLFINRLRFHHMAAVDAALNARVDVNAADSPRDPPLHLAIEQMAVEIARKLISAGADVNRDLGEGSTPLVQAIDIESDWAHQAGRSPGDVPTPLTELLLASGALPTEGPFSWRSNAATTGRLRY
jgi:hypothetical protein